MAKLTNATVRKCACGYGVRVFKCEGLPCDKAFVLEHARLHAFRNAGPGSARLYAWVRVHNRSRLHGRTHVRAPAHTHAHIHTKHTHTHSN